jgi:type II secretory pathway pseudopilin PulG
MAQSSQTESRHPNEAGYMLLAVVVMVALVLIALAVAAPVVARDLRRDKELESQRRMEQYVRAIRIYYRKFNSYPGSIKALESSNNVRYLRHQYVDPLTGKADYRLIHQGEQQTKIHVLFGQELAGLSAGLGSAAGMAGGMGASPGGSSTITSGGLAAGFNGASIGSSGSTGSTGSTGSSGSTGSTGSNSFGDGTGGIIVGVGTQRTGSSITSPNGQDTYEKWEFWYDPRIELLRQSVQLTGGGGASSSSASGFGAGSASTFGQGLNGQSNAASGSTGFTGSTGSTGPPVNPFP